MEALWKVDLHSHTRYSRDAVTDPRDLVERAREAGLDRIAVTDHGTIEGALRARELDPERIIVGEEIRCRCRVELIGLFLRERIPMRLPLEEVVERVRDQGGVIYAPHPYAYPREPLARAGRALDVADIVEAINARAFLSVWNRWAARAASARGLPVGAGSDAHFPIEVGRAYTAMAPFFDAPGFMEASRNAHPVSTTVTHPAFHVASLGRKLARVASEWTRWEPLSPPTESTVS